MYPRFLLGIEITKKSITEDVLPEGCLAANRRAVRLDRDALGILLISTLGTYPFSSPR